MIALDGKQADLLARLVRLASDPPFGKGACRAELNAISDQLMDHEWRELLYRIEQEERSAR